MGDVISSDVLGAVVGMTPLAMGGTEAVKRAFKLPDRIVPAAAIGVGLILAVLLPPNLGWRDEGATGIIAGLAASGLWSGVKATAGR